MGRLAKVCVALGAAAAALAMPSAEAYVSVAAYPAFNAQMGCLVWHGGQAACFYTASGAVAGADVFDDGSVRPGAYAGGPGAAPLNPNRNMVAYSLDGRTSRWQEAQLGEVVSSPSGDYADVNADVNGCKVEFELRRRTDTSGDFVGYFGPSVFPNRPDAGLGVGVEKWTLVDGTGSLCGKTLGIARTLAVTWSVTMTGAHAGESSKNRMAEAIAQIERQAGIDIPPLPSRIEPLG